MSILRYVVDTVSTIVGEVVSHVIDKNINTKNFNKKNINIKNLISDEIINNYNFITKTISKSGKELFFYQNKKNKFKLVVIMKASVIKTSRLSPQNINNMIINDSSKLFLKNMGKEHIKILKIHNLSNNNNLVDLTKRLNEYNIDDDHLIAFYLIAKKKKNCILFNNTTNCKIIKKKISYH